MHVSPKPSWGTRVWVALTEPALQFPEALYDSWVVKRRNFFNRRFMGLLLGTLVGLFFGVAAIGNLVPFAALAVLFGCALVCTDHMFHGVPPLPQQFFKQSFWGSLTYVLFMALVVILTAPLGNVVSGAIECVLAMGLPLIKASRKVASYVKSHDKI